jgi:hypothetical protein
MISSMAYKIVYLILRPQLQFTVRVSKNLNETYHCSDNWDFLRIIVNQKPAIVITLLFVSAYIYALFIK